MKEHNTQPQIGFTESIILMALLISLVALSIDAMLPALPRIGRELGVRHANDVQLIISALVLGLSIGQIIYGPLSDSTGRKPMLFIGVAIFILGCGLSLTTSSLTVMLVGRVLQGVGSAGPRAVVIAIIRDQFEGRAMAKVMSSVMAVFILVPAVAPGFGQAIILVAGWRAIFGVLLVLSLISLIWFALRQPETLPPQYRRPFSPRLIGGAIIEVCRNRAALGYTIATGLILGAFLGYLNSAQQIFEELYGLGQKFPLIFGILALSLGSASFLNARIVMKYGMRSLTMTAMKMLLIIMTVYLAVVYWMGGISPLWTLMVCFMMAFFCVGILFGNLNALAMSPLGHIAGTGSAVVGSLSNLLSIPPAVLIGRYYNGTTLPLITGFVMMSLISLLILKWVQSGKIQPS